MGLNRTTQQYCVVVKNSNAMILSTSDIIIPDFMIRCKMNLADIPDGVTLQTCILLLIIVLLIECHLYEILVITLHNSGSSCLLQVLWCFMRRRIQFRLDE